MAIVGADDSTFLKVVSFTYQLCEDSNSRSPGMTRLHAALQNRQKLHGPIDLEGIISDL